MEFLNHPSRQGFGDLGSYPGGTEIAESRIGSWETRESKEL